MSCQNYITSRPYMYVGWKRDFDHPTTHFHIKNSWKLQKGFWSRLIVSAKNYITTYRGAECCDVTAVLGINFSSVEVCNFQLFFHISIFVMHLKKAFQPRDLAGELCDELYKLFRDF